jgi:hypothetical protein
MDTQQIKLMALEAALKSTATPNCGSYTLENPTGTSQLQCSCYQRTQFSFALFARESNSSNDWRPLTLSLTEQEAGAWLRGAGVLK